MDNTTLSDRLDQQDRLLKEIRDALLGSLDGQTVGLIADHRDLKQRVTNHSTLIASQSTEIAELKSFRRDIKKAVALVAFAIPFAFEVVKGLFGLAWEYLKGGFHK